MKPFAFAAAAAALSFTVAGAAADALDDRKELMKERGSVMRILGPIAQGKAPFDAAAVNEGLATLDANARRAVAEVDALWPQGSDSGDTKALPAIWADFDAFKAANGKLAEATAASAAPQDLAAFQAAFGPVAASCGSCHETYRRP
mgnify:CR=1 FL=1